MLTGLNYTFFKAKAIQALKLRLYFIGLLFILSTGWVLAQNSFLRVNRSERVIGKNHWLNEEIKATVYTFPERIHHCYIDTLKGYATVEMRGLTKNGKYLKNKGKVMVVDLLAGRTIWDQNINYLTSYLEQYGRSLFKREGGKVFYLDIESGNRLWESKNSLYLVDPIDRIGLGYRTKSIGASSNNLEGINLSNGNMIWSRNVRQDFTWNELHYTNDSTIILVASGLHDINIFDGTGWSYHAVTGEKNYKQSLLKTLLGSASMGYSARGTDPKSAWGVVSNLEGDSISYFLASKNELVRIANKDGSIMWRYPLPEDMASKSNIFLEDNMVFMVNLGYAYKGISRIFYGKPFFAAFNREDGSMVHFNYLDVKKDAIQDAILSGDTLALVFDEKIVCFSKSDGKFLLEKEFSKEEVLGKLLGFVKNVPHILQDSLLMPLIVSEKAKYYIISNEPEVIFLNEDFDYEGEMPFEELYLQYFWHPLIKLIRKDNKTYIVGQDHQILAEINTNRKGAFINETLFFIEEKEILLIELAGLFDNYLEELLFND
ncbi:MAG TPA: PQQ-binding-like beta-propeller repeat protein [Saprospiraceae bacterium]|nr:PQQ-binding-like beta-propeller repeat protein [Saprospiraceae bacterium]